MPFPKWQNDQGSFPRETIQYHSNPGLCTTLIIESEEELKNLLIKVKEGCEIAGLKLNIQKTVLYICVSFIFKKNPNIQEATIMGSYLITSLQ